MCGNNGSHIMHAAVAAFYIVLIKQLMIPVAAGEMFSCAGGDFSPAGSSLEAGSSSELASFLNFLCR